ncbi:MAG TPA: hypothetical protein VHM65_10850, partial [Candidatus Lustribacter sp.]|nr:hypothetical protein [Candidatus Lustribacter sp.]
MAFGSEHLRDGPCAVVPSPEPPGLPPVLSTYRYGGAVTIALRAYKDAGRRDLGPVLAPALAPALTLALRVAARDPSARG